MLIDDYDLLSAPVNYISYQVRSTDGRAHDAQLLLTASPLIAVHFPSFYAIHGIFAPENENYFNIHLTNYYKSMNRVLLFAVSLLLSMTAFAQTPEFAFRGAAERTHGVGALIGALVGQRQKRETLLLDDDAVQSSRMGEH